jgi:hypothetical protein
LWMTIQMSSGLLCFCTSARVKARVSADVAIVRGFSVLLGLVVVWISQSSEQDCERIRRGIGGWIKGQNEVAPRFGGAPIPDIWIGPGFMVRGLAENRS